MKIRSLFKFWTMMRQFRLFNYLLCFVYRGISMSDHRMLLLTPVENYLLSCLSTGYWFSTKSLLNLLHITASFQHLLSFIFFKWERYFKIVKIIYFLKCKWYFIMIIKICISLAFKWSKYIVYHRWPNKTRKL